MKNGDRRPNVKPVTKLELSEKDVRKRTILAGVFLVIGIVAIGYGLFSLLNTQPGWVEVQISNTETNVSPEFTLMYDFSQSGGSATFENKQLSLLYTQAVRDAHVIFSPDEAAADNLYALNAAPGKPVKVHPVLYEAFRLLEEYGDRSVFLAPVYTEYDRVFRAEGDGEAMIYDPDFSQEAAALIEEMTAYTSDPDHVRVEVLEDGYLRLEMSEAYLAYAEENGIETFLDFGWLRNAFVADFLAARLEEGGFTRGYLESYDGFIRNLDSRAEGYSVNIFHKEGRDVYIPARVETSGKMASVRFRAYPVDAQDNLSFHLYADGTAVSGFIAGDGRNKTALEDLLVIGAGKTCAELALSTAPYYIVDTLSEEGLESLLEEGIGCIWCAGGKVISTDESLTVTLLDSAYTH